jgi:hypothetical protein
LSSCTPDQHHIGIQNLLVAAGGRLDRHFQAGALLFHARDLGGKMEGHALFGQDALKRLADFQIDARRDAIEEFHHRDFGAQPAPDRT